MSKAEFEFEIVFDKEKETSLQKIKRWGTKQKPPLDLIFKYLFSFVEKWYWEGKELQTKHRIDREVKYLGDLWEKEDELNRPKAKIVEEGLFGEEGWSISISNPVVDRGPEETDGRLGDRSDEKGLGGPLPDPWDATGDWNDWAIGFTLENHRNELRKSKTDSTQP